MLGLFVAALKTFWVCVVEFWSNFRTTEIYLHYSYRMYLCYSRERVQMCNESAHLNPNDSHKRIQVKSSHDPPRHTFY